MVGWIISYLFLLSGQLKLPNLCLPSPSSPQRSLIIKLTGRLFLSCFIRTVHICSGMALSSLLSPLATIHGWKLHIVMFFFFSQVLFKTEMNVNFVAKLFDNYMLCIYWLYITPYFQTEGDNLSLSETITSDTGSLTGAEIQTPNTLRKGELQLFLEC